MNIRSLTEGELHRLLNDDIEGILELSEEEIMSILTELERRDYDYGNAINLQEAWADFNRTYRPMNHN